VIALIDDDEAHRRFVQRPRRAEAAKTAPYHDDARAAFVPQHRFNFVCRGFGMNVHIGRIQGG
jgi:hypothetical protein